MPVSGTIERGAIRRKPRPAASLRQIRKMGYEGERQRQVTNGWYARGKFDAEGNWTPELGLPGDIFVYLPMGAPYEREHYPDKGYLALSDVPNKKAIARRTNGPEFIIEPPDFELVSRVMAAIRERADEAVAATRDELADIDEQLADSSALMKGEAPQLRSKRKKLQERIKLLQTPDTFDAVSYYKAFVAERMSVLKAQEDPQQARHAELEREYKEWQDHLAGLENQLAAAPSTGSASSSKTSTKSTPPGQET